MPGDQQFQERLYRLAEPAGHRLAVSDLRVRRDAYTCSDDQEPLAGFLTLPGPYRRGHQGSRSCDRTNNLSDFPRMCCRPET